MDKIAAPEFSLRSLLRGGTGTTGTFGEVPTLETPRLRLRKMRMRDAADLYEWTSDRKVARYVLWDAHQSIGDTRAYLRYIRSLYRQGLPSSWGIELRETGKIIGTIGVMAWSPENRSVEVGYSLGRQWWHQGYAAEALSCLMNLLFDRMKINRIEAQCDVRNPDSARVMEKCGMRKEGLLRQRVFNKGEYVDVLLYAALAADHAGKAGEVRHG